MPKSRAFTANFAASLARRPREFSLGKAVRQLCSIGEGVVVGPGRAAVERGGQKGRGRLRNGAELKGDWLLATA
jgi:hypothetical protein